jgi:hypothetical protein
MTHGQQRRTRNGGVLVLAVLLILFFAVFRHSGSTVRAAALRRSERGRAAGVDRPVRRSVARIPPEFG